MKKLLLPAVIIVTFLIGAACGSIPGPAAPGSESTPPVSQGCAHFSRHQYEVCYAYLVKDSLLARVPYYEVGRQPLLARAALTRFESRYYGPARRFIIDQTKGWPSHVDVSVPIIRIVGAVRVSANLASATITTVETWLVRAEQRPGHRSGRVLFAETNVRHTISLERTPTILCAFGHCLHKWVVLRIR